MQPWSNELVQWGMHAGQSGTLFKKKKKTVSNYKQVIKRKNQGKLMRGIVAEKCDGHGYS